MDRYKKIKSYFVQKSPGYNQHLGEERTKTSKMMYARNRVAFSNVFAPGFHVEGEDIIWDKRLKGGFLRHFRYFGPRGEILFYAFFVIVVTRLFRNNLKREETIDSVLNDRNVYYKVDLPLNLRKIN